MDNFTKALAINDANIVVVIEGEESEVLPKAQGRGLGREDPNDEANEHPAGGVAGVEKEGDE